MPEKSLIEYAFEILSSQKEPMSFKELFDKALEAKIRKIQRILILY